MILVWTNHPFEGQGRHMHEDVEIRIGAMIRLAMDDRAPRDC
jgi:hypothetical protein